jgi:hypothetical protein
MKTSSKKSAPGRIVTPEEVIREFKLETKTKEKALDFLYRAGIVTKKGNLRKFYRSSKKTKTA